MEFRGQPRTFVEHAVGWKSLENSHLETLETSGKVSSRGGGIHVEADQPRQNASLADRKGPHQRASANRKSVWVEVSLQ